MNKVEMMATQNTMRERGFYEGEIDGIWGPMSTKAMADMIAYDKQSCTGEVAPVASTTKVNGKVIWGSKVSKDFIASVQWIADELLLDPAEGVNWLMACMAFESGESFSPTVRNGAGSGAIGLIQFMPDTAVALGAGSTRDSAVAKLASLTAVQQLNYVYKYFIGRKGKLRNLGDVYMAILWPAGVGKADDWVLWNSKTKPTTYRQNAGLDVNKDGIITRGEALRKIQEKYNRGRSFMG